MTARIAIAIAFESKSVRKSPAAWKRASSSARIWTGPSRLPLNGLVAPAIVWKHALRNAMLPLVTLIALSLGSIVAGAIVVEDVFSYPGIGLATIDALNRRDYPVLQGIFLILTLSVIIANFIADLVYFKLDPRITE